MRLTAEKSVAIRQDFQCPGAANDFAPFDLLAHHADDQLGPAHSAVVNNAIAFGVSEELGHRKTIQIV